MQFSKETLLAEKEQLAFADNMDELFGMHWETVSATRSAAEWECQMQGLLSST